MATGANAVFTEVLEMQVDTARFKADMDTLITMYTQALTQMNAASAGSGMSTGMAQLSAQLQTLGVQAQQSLGMVAASSNVAANELLDVAGAAMKTTAALSGTAAAATATSASVTATGNAASTAGYKAGLSWENFGRQLQRAMLRLPAMLIVATAFGAAFEAIKAPIDFVVDGLKNLEESPLGAGLRDDIEQLDKMKLRFESIAAFPLFTFIVEQLALFNKWMVDNKGVVDQFLLSIGQLGTTFLSTITNLLLAIGKTDAFKDTMQLIAAAAVLIGSGLAQAVVSLTALIELASHAGNAIVNKPKDFVKAVAGGASGGAAGLSAALGGFVASDPTEGPATDAIINKWTASSLKVGSDMDNALAAINGTGKQAIPDVPGKSYDTTADVQKKFREQVAAAKDAAAEEVAAISEQVHKGVLSHQEAAPQIHAILDAEKLKVDSLVRSYSALAAAAIRGAGKGTLQEQDAAISAAQSGFRTVGMNVSKSVTGSANSGETKADNAAFDESREIRQADATEELEYLKAADKALEAEQQDHYKNGLETVRDYYDQKRALDKKAYDDASAAITSAQSGLSTSSVAYNTLANKQVGLDQANTNNNSATDRAEADATKKVNEELLKASDELEKQREAQADINVKLLESNSHRKAALSLEEQILAAKAAQAKLDLQFADKQLGDGRQQGTPAFAQGQVAQQGALANVLATFMQQIQAASARAASTSLTPNYSGAQGGLQQAQQINNGAQAALSSAQMKEASNPGSIDPSKMQALQQAADAAATALQRAASAADGMHLFTDALKDVTQVLGTVKGAVEEYVSGFKKGGVIGGLGNVLSDKGVTGEGGLVQKGASALGDAAGGVIGAASSALGAAVPFIGPAIGMMFSVITSLFSSGIQKMVDAINKQISDIKNSAAAGQIGLGQEITELQQAKQTAISELGGSKKKGAQQQLDSILESLNAQIAQLQFQQHQIIQNFENMTKAGSLDTLSQTFSQWYQTWDNINQQVKTYVDAGGSIATANEYLNQQLAIQRQALQDQLNQGDQTALQDAVQLNQLLTQRVQLMKTEAETEFGIVNSDSVERRTSMAVAAGNQLNNQRYQFQQQLLQMNEQVTLDQQRLAVEGKIFDVTGNLQQLWAKLNTDNITALNEQLAKYKDMQAILAATNGLVFSGPISNVPTANLPIPGEPTIAGPITVNVIVGGQGITPGNASSIGNEIARGIRSGRTNLAMTT